MTASREPASERSAAGGQPGRVLTIAVAAIALCSLSLHSTAPGSQTPPRKPLTFSILEDYDRGDPLDEVERDFAAFAELDVRTWRGSIGWDDYEPARGRYDFAWLHTFLERAAARGIDARPYVGYTPEWAAGGKDSDKQAWNQPPASQDVWRRFVTALATELRHHGNVKSLEIYNEENVTQWWDGPRERYADTLRTGARAARAAGMKEILMGGLVFPDLEWVESVCQAGRAARSFDILPVHAYPETWTPADVTVESYLGSGFARDFVAAADRACGRKPIWINETGFATTAGKTERDQAAWWVRAIATFAAEPRVEHIGIYEIRDLHPDRPAIGDAPNYHLGLTRADRTRKLAFATVDMLTDLLDVKTIGVEDSAVEIRSSTRAGELHYRLFVRPDDDRILIVWNRTQDDAVAIAPAQTATKIVEYSLEGTTVDVAADGLANVALTKGVPRIYRFFAR